MPCTLLVIPSRLTSCYVYFVWSRHLLNFQIFTKIWFQSMFQCMQQQEFDTFWKTIFLTCNKIASWIFFFAFYFCMIFLYIFNNTFIQVFTRMISPSPKKGIFAKVLYWYANWLLWHAMKFHHQLFSIKNHFLDFLNFIKSS